MESAPPSGRSAPGRGKTRAARAPRSSAAVRDLPRSGRGFDQARRPSQASKLGALRRGGPAAPRSFERATDQVCALGMTVNRPELIPTPVLVWTLILPVFA